MSIQAGLGNRALNRAKGTAPGLAGVLAAGGLGEKSVGKAKELRIRAIVLGTLEVRLGYKPSQVWVGSGPCVRFWFGMMLGQCAHKNSMQSSSSAHMEPDMSPLFALKLILPTCS